MIYKMVTDKNAEIFKRTWEQYIFVNFVRKESFRWFRKEDTVSQEARDHRFKARISRHVAPQKRFF